MAFYRRSTLAGVVKMKPALTVLYGDQCRNIFIYW